MSTEKLSSMLDDIANRLEARGLVKEAHTLDMIANTVEKNASSFSFPNTGPFETYYTIGDYNSLPRIKNENKALAQGKAQNKNVYKHYWDYAHGTGKGQTIFEADETPTLKPEKLPPSVPTQIKKEEDTYW